ncbi:MAG TPA: penicillin-binding transpeptidase domain-containing protein [Mycobacteriales bacterium]|nr:penicillin-binding transpeptidase domain-containing protein [Mycobacteriales bacterium]
MNRPLRKVAIAALVMFAALLINANVVQVVEATSLKNNQHNVRLLYSEYSHQRGPIVVGRTAIARSVATHDALKYLRVYPEGPLYAPVTGYYSLTYSYSGIEQEENSILAGTSDKLFVKRLSDVFTGRQPQGGAVELTINAQLQQAAYTALAGRRGAVVALDPRTGAILALVSSPSYDPSRISTHNQATNTAAWNFYLHNPDAPMLDRAISQTYPPGSTFKVITTAAALSSGRYTPSTLIPAPNSLSFNDSNRKLHNFQGETCAGGGRMTLADALRVSCNTAYGDLGIALGSNALLQQAQAFGLGRSLSIPLPVVSSRFVAEHGQALTADSAIGQASDAVTPLQMAMVAAGVANGGVVMRPYLVSQERAPDSSVIAQAQPQELGRAISPAVAAQLTSMMQRVVTSGTGTAAQVPGVSVAGKTGTAENVPGRPTHAWFICFAPAQDPQVAIAVIVENGGIGGSTAAPIARQVLRAALGR